MSKEFSVLNTDGDLTVSVSRGTIAGMPPAIYTPIPTMQGLIWHKVMDRFRFSYKLYDIRPGFGDRVVNTFFHKEYFGKNMGVLLSGDKGTGKTVIAKQICNAFLDAGTPVITITSPDENLSSKIAEIGQTVVVFIDEYDKVFNDGYVDSLLGFMDGSQSPEHPVLLLLTINSGRISDYLINRMGRIRYNVSFTRIEPGLVANITKDSLQNQDLRHSVWNVFSRVKQPTVDLLTEIIRETNIYQQSPEDFADIINLKPDVLGYTYSFFLPGNPEELFSLSGIEGTDRPMFWMMPGERRRLRVRFEDIGSIEAVITTDTVLVSCDPVDLIQFIDDTGGGKLAKMSDIDLFNFFCEVSTVSTDVVLDEQEKKSLARRANGFGINTDALTDEDYRKLVIVRYGRVNLVAVGKEVIVNNDNFVHEIEAAYDLIKDV